MSFVLVGIFACTMLTLGLFLSAFANALISLSWGTLAYQRWQSDHRAAASQARAAHEHEPIIEPLIAPIEELEPVLAASRRD